MRTDSVPESMSLEIARCRGSPFNGGSRGLVAQRLAGRRDPRPRWRTDLIVAAHFVLAWTYLRIVSDPRMRLVPWIAGRGSTPPSRRLLPRATAGSRSPFFAFTAFAIIAAAFDGHPRRAPASRLVCVAFYVGPGAARSAREDQPGGDARRLPRDLELLGDAFGATPVPHRGGSPERRGGDAARTLCTRDPRRLCPAAGRTRRATRGESHVDSRRPRAPRR